MDKKTLSGKMLLGAEKKNTIDKVTIAAAVHLLQRRGEPVSLPRIHQLTGGSWREITYWLQEVTTPAQMMLQELHSAQAVFDTLANRLRTINVHTLLQAGLSIETVHALGIILHHVCTNRERFIDLLDQITQELNTLTEADRTDEESPPLGRHNSPPKRLDSLNPLR